MKTFKKALSIILGVAIMLSCLFGMQVSVAAEETETPANPLTIGVGEVNVADGVVTVPVEVINNPGFITLSVIVGYNNEELQLTNSAKVADFATVAAPGNDVPSEVGEISPDFKEINWAYVSDEDVTATGTIATFTFEVLDETLASTDITLEVDEASNAADEDVTATAEGTTVVLKDEPVVPPVCEEHTGEWTVVTPATTDASGSKTRTCTVCGEVENAVIPRIIRFRSGNLELSNSIGVQFKVRAEYFDIYDDIYVSFSFKGEESYLYDYTYDATGNAVFTFTGTTPLTVNETVTATIYGVYDGETYVGTEADKGVVPYGIRTYCESKIDSSSDLNKTLIVDMLNYCAAYEAYDTAQNGTVYEEAANAWLTDAQKAYGTSELRELVSHQELPVKEIDNPTVAFKAGALNLVSTVEMRIAIDELNYTDLTILAEAVDTEGNVIDEWTITPENTTFITSGSRTYFYFDQLYATQFSTPIQFTIYRDGAVVSNTLQYSVESYCYAKQEDAVLGNLVKAIAKYGDAAYASYNP